MPSRSSFASGRASLSIAARRKVDEATPASMQGQVGIGLSLLQESVGGLSSDSESEYGDSDDECFATNDEARLMKRQVQHTCLAVRNGGMEIVDAGSAKATNIRASLAESEGSTAERLKYASGEDDVELSAMSNPVVSLLLRSSCRLQHHWIQTLKKEKELMDSLVEQGSTRSQAFELLTHTEIATSQMGGADAIFDASDRLEGGDVIVWWNDIEKVCSFPSLRPNDLNLYLIDVLNGFHPCMGYVLHILLADPCQKLPISSRGKCSGFYAMSG